MTTPRSLAAACTTAIVLALLACSPTSVCGCSYPLGQGAAQGFVLDSAGTALTGVTVEAIPTPEACAYPAFFFNDARTETNGAGWYELSIESDIGPVCIDVLAIRGDTLAADTVRSAAVIPLGQPGEPVRVDLTFPN